MKTEKLYVRLLNVLLNNVEKYSIDNLSKEEIIMQKSLMELGYPSKKLTAFIDLLIAVTGKEIKFNVNLYALPFIPIVPLERRDGHSYSLNNVCVTHGNYERALKVNGALGNYLPKSAIISSWGRIATKDEVINFINQLNIDGIRTPVKVELKKYLLELGY